MESVCERRIFPVTAAEYKLLEEIGQGVSATVYRALCLPFKEIVAIKALDLEKCNSNLDDIRREAVTMSLINHANVVRAFCSFVVEQRLWVVMPYMSGGSCLHIMKSFYIDGFEEAVIATLLKEVLKALEYLHRHGHIHRDVKAGNILVDGTGAVKLADFGVSACMFDTGDRQRSRKTFVGTPCWMAPEVMEQLHGYDFKADIWSFGITALELAHGHAPFSKYPPMKVLLMTLQNAPPGLDYERDKRFSKAFKEMISMCLVKDPSKRPTAEKLLRHSFFKHARTPDYICRHVLDGLPPLGDRIRSLKNADDARFAQQKLNFDEQEQRSQTEYKRGVSSWNFDVEDLRAQSALIPDDDNTPSQAAKEGAESAEFSSQPGSWDSGGSPDRGQLPNYTQSVKVEVANGNGGYLTAPRNFPSSKPAGRCLSVKKEPKHIGRFDVFEDDNVLESPGWHNSPKNEHRRGEEREPRRFDEKERDESRRGTSGPLVPERVGSSVRGRDEDQDRDFRHGRVNDRGSFSGPLVPTGERACLDHRPANGFSRPSSGVSKEALEEKSKGPAQKVPVVQRGRFSVTSDGGLEDLPHVSSRRNMCAQGSQQNHCVPAPSLSSSNLNGVSVPTIAIMPHLQNALQLAVMQQDALLHIMNGINPSEAANSLRSFSNSKRSSEHSLADIQNERERDHLQQIADLQSKLSQLLEEQRILKSRNVALERQLNAIYNKEEEERIRKEEAAKEDG